MTYLAPRQGLFAIIVLVSFCLHTLLLVVSTDHQLSKSRVQKGEQMVAQLINEARLSLENEDRVSLSVIANRYTSEQDVARLVIKGRNDEVLVPVGNAPMQQGITVRQMATQGDAVIGSVALTLKDISKGEIVAMQWPFVISALFMHLFLWLLYGYVARPTKDQINALSRDILDMHREDKRLGVGPSTEHYDNARSRSDIGNSMAQPNEPLTAATPIKTADIHSEVNAYLRSQQQSDSAESAADKLAAPVSDYTDSIKTEQPLKSETSASSTRSTDKNFKLSSTRMVDEVSVQLKFHDEYNMLERLAPEMRMPYLALCTQLLNQATTELLRQPLLLGVSLLNKPRFAENGATVELKADNSHAKVALAGVMLAKLYLMLNKIIHDKHIELARFALPAKAGVSDGAQAEAMTQLLSNVATKEQLLVLLPSAGLKQISNQVQLRSLKRPTTVYERECAVFEGGSDSMIQRLTDVRNKVLLVGEKDS